MKNGRGWAYDRTEDMPPNGPRLSQTRHQSKHHPPNLTQLALRANHDGLIPGNRVVTKKDSCPDLLILYLVALTRMPGEALVALESPTVRSSDTIGMTRLQRG